MTLPPFVVALAGALGVLSWALPERGSAHEPLSVVKVQGIDRNRIGRSYVEPRTVPGDSGPALTTPGYQPRATPRANSRPAARPSTGMPPTASDCAAGYSARSRWTRGEFNRMCGQGS